MKHGETWASAAILAFTLGSIAWGIGFIVRYI
jgi:hypothetical protein